MALLSGSKLFDLDDHVLHILITHLVPNEALVLELSCHRFRSISHENQSYWKLHASIFDRIVDLARMPKPSSFEAASVHFMASQFVRMIEAIEDGCKTRRVFKEQWAILERSRRNILARFLSNDVVTTGGTYEAHVLQTDSRAFATSIKALHVFGTPADFAQLFAQEPRVARHHPVTRFIAIIALLALFYPSEDGDINGSVQSESMPNAEMLRLALLRPSSELAAAVKLSTVGLDHGAGTPHDVGLGIGGHEIGVERWSMGRLPNSAGIGFRGRDVRESAHASGAGLAALLISTLDSRNARSFDGLDGAASALIVPSEPATCESTAFAFLRALFQYSRSAVPMGVLSPRVYFRAHQACGSPLE